MRDHKKIMLSFFFTFPQDEQPAWRKRRLGSCIEDAASQVASLARVDRTGAPFK